MLISRHSAARMRRAGDHLSRQRRRGGREAEVPYRVWVRAWVAREEIFEDRNSAELFRLKLAASRPSLNPSDVAVVAEQLAASDPGAGGLPWRDRCRAV